MSFGAACNFIRWAGVAPDVMFPASIDVFAAQWLQHNGDLRRICGTAPDLGRAMPQAPLAALSINLSAIHDEVLERANALLDLKLVGMGFEDLLDEN
jgi:hypothetical protein